MTRSSASCLRAGATAGALVAAVAVTAVLGACRKAPQPSVNPLPFKAVEVLYQETRTLKDQIDVTRDRGASSTPAGVTLADLIGRFNTSRAGVLRGLATGSFPDLTEEDRRAVEVMKRALEKDLIEEKVEKVAPAEGGSIETAPGGENGGTAADLDCDGDPEAVAKGPDGYEALTKRIYACFGAAARSLSFEGRTMDRLTVFGLLPLTDEPARRRALFMAMAPIWTAVNGDNSPRSPYRTLVRLNAARLKDKGETLGESVRQIGVEPAVMEEWLTSVLEAWRDSRPDAPIEPWDFAYAAGRASRALRRAIPLESLRPINDRYYRDLGADPVALRVQYDLEPRAGKDPVAFTTFGRRPRLDDIQVRLGEPWVFASYQIGGLDNLLELLHETGHAIHIAAIRTRPAFTDWPDSDIFTEGIADIASLEMYEPAWQKKYLGASVPLADAIAAKYSGIVMDTAWALFEVRLNRQPERDPNEVWTEITSEYFRIKPHPELAWWAVRGQLIDAPGYMMNYAAGAILVADLRAQVKKMRGRGYTEGDPDWYNWVTGSLYRYGLERTSKNVIEGLLGRPVAPYALLDDMGRAVQPSKRAGI